MAMQFKPGDLLLTPEDNRVWLIFSKGLECGPYPEWEVVSAVKSKTFLGDAAGFTEGMENWQRLDSIYPFMRVLNEYQQIKL